MTFLPATLQPRRNQYGASMGEPGEMQPTPSGNQTPQSVYAAHKIFAEELKLTAELFGLGAAFLAAGSTIWKFFDLAQYAGLIWLAMALAGFVSVIGAITFGTLLVFTAFIRVEWLIFGVQVQSTPPSWMTRFKSIQFWFGFFAAVLVAVAMIRTISVAFNAS